MQPSSIKELIKAITFGNKLFVCIHDISGICSAPLLQPDIANCWHTIDFCNVAKTTGKGHSACINCKLETNKKVMEKGTYICRACSFGLDEVVRPVFIEGKPKCMIYIGNMVTNREETLKRLKATCKQTGVSYKKMAEKLEDCEFVEDLSPIIRMSALIENYIHCLYQGGSGHSNDKTWVLDKILEYIEFSYAEKVTLKDMAKLFFYNEKYLGRVFKAHTGTSFHQYVSNLRLQKATDLLAETEKSIVEIACDCGFTDGAYFNRVFKAKMNLNPSEFKKMNQGLTEEKKSI